MNHRPLRGNPSDRERQQKLRDRRKAQGWRRITVWLSPEQAGRLETLGGDAWLGRTVKALLGRAVAEPRRGKQSALFDAPGPVSDSGGEFSTTVKKGGAGDFPNAIKGDAAALVEADSLKAQGLSWGEIARRWNAEGRRTERGAEFRGANISRDWRKWKGEG